MELAIELFGYLILTVLGFVLPIVAILLSVYHEGMSKLAYQYQAEVSQSEENLKKIAKAKKTDVVAIQQSITELKDAQKKQERSCLIYILEGRSFGYSYHLYLLS